MNSSVIVFVVVAAVALVAVPRRLASLPLLAVACYMTLGQEIDLGPFTFTALRLIIPVGFLRALVRGERPVGGVNRLDALVLAWGAWLVASSMFHEDPSRTLVTHLGLVYNTLGAYWLFRIFCSSADDFVSVAKIAAVVLVPVAVAMVYEHVAFRNMFSIFGGVPEVPQVREGQIRASGPFAHPILAGTVGGVVLPFMLALWYSGARFAALFGSAACVTMVFASGSSGPVMSMLVAAGAVAAWRFRRHMRAFRWAIAAALLLLIVTMDRPPYYIIQRFEVFGGSTGWYRSRLIESSVEHLGEWWLAGTDFTRHWMPENNAISEQHTDVTNHYLAQGVQAGLPLLILYLAILVTGFSFAGRGFAEASRVSGDPKYKYWSWILGCALFSHVLTMISVSYFDQSAMFLYLTLAALASLRGVQLTDEAPQRTVRITAFAPREPANPSAGRQLPGKRPSIDAARPSRGTSRARQTS